MVRVEGNLRAAAAHRAHVSKMWARDCGSDGDGPVSRGGHDPRSRSRGRQPILVAAACRPEISVDSVVLAPDQPTGSDASATACRLSARARPYNSARTRVLLSRQGGRAPLPAADVQQRRAAIDVGGNCWPCTRRPAGRPRAASKIIERSVVLCRRRSGARRPNISPRERSRRDSRAPPRDRRTPRNREHHRRRHRREVGRASNRCEHSQRASSLSLPPARLSPPRRGLRLRWSEIPTCHGPRGRRAARMIVARRRSDSRCVPRCKVV